MILPEHNGGAILKTKFVRLLSNRAFLCLLLAAAAFTVFWPVTRCDFINYDDPDYFTANPHVLSGLTSANFVWAFTTGHASNWHPLTWLSLMLDAEVFGKGPFGPHFANLFFHAANTVLLFLLLRKLTAATWRSAFVAALFALHPLHVESVAWVSERKDVLSTFFALLALLSYTRYAKEKRPRDFWRALVFFALALMSKPMVVTLPFVMLLLDWWPLQRFTIHDPRSTACRLVLEKIPFFVLSAIACVITFVVQQKGGAVATLVKFPMSVRVTNAFVSCARYLRKIFWPDVLATPYSHPGHWPVLAALFAFALFAGLCAAAICFRRRFPFAFTGWFWFAGMLVPVIGLVQVGDAALADRYTYLSSVGIFIIVAWIAAELGAKWRLANLPFIFLGAIILVACGLRTREQLNYWQNSGTLFRHALAVTKNNYVAYIDLGTWLSGQGRTAEAMECFNQSLQIKPDNADSFYYMGSTLYNLGNTLAKQGKWNEAVENYRRALKFTPDQADILDNLGFALAASKQLDEAITNFETALKIKPDYADAHNNLATVLFMEHRFAEAAQHYREAIRFAPDNPQIYANLGDVLARLGQFAEAAQNYQAALRLNPDDARTRAKLQALGAQISN